MINYENLQVKEIAVLRENDPFPDDIKIIVQIYQTVRWQSSFDFFWIESYNFLSLVKLKNIFDVNIYPMQTTTPSPIISKFVVVNHDHYLQYTFKTKFHLDENDESIYVSKIVSDEKFEQEFLTIAKLIE